MYAWAARPDSPIDIVGFSFYPSRFGARSMDAGFRVDGIMNGTPVRLCVDTGSPMALLPLATAQRCGLTVLTTEREVTDGTGARRTASGEADMALHLGSTTFYGRAVCLRASPAPLGDGLIGFNLVLTCAWLFDAPQRVAHMAPAVGAEQLLRDCGYRVSDMLTIGHDEWRPMVTVRLDTRDTIVIYSDGVTDAQDSSHQLFGEKRLEDAVKSGAGQSPDELLTHIRAAATHHMYGKDPIDDMTIVIVRFESPAAVAVNPPAA